MSRLGRLFVLALLLVLPFTAAADSPVAFRVGPGVQMTCSASAPAKLSTRGMIYCNSADANKLHYSDPSGTDAAIGGGGGSSTLATVYANGTTGNDSKLSIDSTRLGLKLLAPASALGTILSVRNNADTASMFLITDNSTQQLKSFMADGASAEAVRVDTNTAWSNSTAKLLRLMSGGTEKWSWTPNGVMNMVANSSFVGASSATNTTGLTLTQNVATGASSIAFAMNNTTDMTTGKLLSIQSAGTERLSFLWSGTVAQLQGGSAVTSFLANDNTGFQANSGSGYIYNAGTANYIFASTGFTNNGGSQTVGTSSIPWPATFSKRVAHGTQSLSFSATPAFDCTAGNVIHIGTITANVTGPTMVAGSAGERCTIVFLKDATAGTYTIAGWGSNTRTSGTLTFTSGASSLVTITFVWDDRLSTPAWVETNRTAFN